MAENYGGLGNEVPTLLETATVPKTEAKTSAEPDLSVPPIHSRHQKGSAPRSRREGCQSVSKPWKGLPLKFAPAHES